MGHNAIATYLDAPPAQQRLAGHVVDACMEGSGWLPVCTAPVKPAAYLCGLSNCKRAEQLRKFLAVSVNLRVCILHTPLEVPGLNSSLCQTIDGA